MAKKGSDSKKKKSSSKGEKSKSSKKSSVELTPSELAGLDFLIKDLEEHGGSSPDVGILPGLVVGWLVRKAVEWILEKGLWYLILRKLLQGASGLSELSERDIQEAEKLLKELPEPTLEDLKKIRSLIKVKK